MDEKLTFVQRVIERLKGGDEKKLERFRKRTIKALDSQIKDRTESIADLKDKLDDLKEAKQDAILDVNLEKIKTTEDTKNYVSQYIQLQVDLLAKERGYEESIRHSELEIKVFESIKEQLEDSPLVVND